uniref:Uncharacterized protein n=1 Tax=Amphimedon queenslandica TaxID=400682 RepID=A0A1X7TCH4_AMPQE
MFYFCITSSPSTKFSPPVSSPISSLSDDDLVFTKEEVVRFERRWENGYDIKTDARYNAWLKAKGLDSSSPHDDQEQSTYHQPSYRSSFSRVKCKNRVTTIGLNGTIESTNTGASTKGRSTRGTVKSTDTDTGVSTKGRSTRGTVKSTDTDTGVSTKGRSTRGTVNNTDFDTGASTKGRSTRGTVKSTDTVTGVSAKGCSARAVKLSLKEHTTVQIAYVLKNLSQSLLGLPAIRELRVISHVNDVTDRSIKDQYPLLFKGLGTFNR